jgi:hypothetical protein
LDIYLQVLYINTALSAAPQIQEFGNEVKTVPTLTLLVRRSGHSARSHLSSVHDCYQITFVVRGVYSEP